MKSANEIKKDMLSMSSAVNELIRAMFMSGADYIMIMSATGERLVHKEQLTSLMERGRDEATAADLISEQLKERLSGGMEIESVPTGTKMLLLRQIGEDGTSELTLTTFGAFRESKIYNASSVVPDWWDVPQPLIYFDDEQVLLNPTAETFVPGGAVAMARQVDKLRADRIVTLKDGKGERTFSLKPLGDDTDTYLIEDISGDFEMAEDLLWWAAVGRAFVGRMQSNGLTVKRLSPFEEIPSEAAEVIPCRWENELVGRLAITMPKQERQADRAKRPRAPKKTPRPVEDDAAELSAEAAEHPSLPEIEHEQTSVEQEAPVSASETVPDLAPQLDPEEIKALEPDADSGDVPVTETAQEAQPEEPAEQEIEEPPVVEQPPKPQPKEIRKLNEVRQALRGAKKARAEEDENYLLAKMTQEQEPEVDPNERENLRAYAAKTAYGIKSQTDAPAPQAQPDPEPEPVSQEEEALSPADPE